MPEGKPHPSIGMGRPCGAIKHARWFGIVWSWFGEEIVRGAYEKERKNINVYGEETEWGGEMKWNINLNKNQNKSPTKTVPIFQMKTHLKHHILPASFKFKEPK